MKYIFDQLPHEFAQQLHPDRRRNEVDYWAMHDQLLARYRDQWVGFADGRVIAAGKSPVAVLHESEATGLHPFFVCVGREEEPCRIRRSSFAYDSSYPGEAFRTLTSSSGRTADRRASLWIVIPDTGADASVLPWADCQLLQLDPASASQGLIGGVGGSSAATLVFSIWIGLDGNEYSCRLQADPLSNERILGRDVLNRLEVLFRGPSGEVVVNP